MEIDFTPVEIRVLGCLVEKENTTPEAYPLTLNALTRACSQKSNREPVMELTETTVLDALESLSKHMLISRKSGGDSRSVKYSHRLRERRTPEFDFSPEELAVVSVLLLRGALTPGEIRIRCERIHHFEELQSLLAALQKLIERPDGPYVKQLPRHPGQKESRYVHLFAGDVEDDMVMSVHAPSSGSSKDRIAELEVTVSSLQTELSALEQRFDDFVKQFE